MPRCKPGDLAVVVQARNPSNLGKIVRVLGVHDGKGELHMKSLSDTVWDARCPNGVMVWCSPDGSRRWRRARGPIPDGQLCPIRGDGSTPRAQTPIDVVRRLADQAKVHAGSTPITA